MEAEKTVIKEVPQIPMSFATLLSNYRAFETFQDVIREARQAQAEISFKAGIREVVDYFSRHWMGATKGMLIYEIPDKDRDLLEDGMVPN